MNSTIVLNPAPDPATSERPPKRQKRARSRNGRDARFHQTYDVTIGRLGLSPSPTIPGPDARKRRPSHKQEERAEELGAEESNAGPTLRKNKRPTIILRMSQHPDLAAQQGPVKPASTDEALDFSQAPNDPSEFIWWIADHITHMRSSISPGGSSVAPGLDAMTSIMRPLRMVDGEGGSEVFRERDKEKQRVDNRERKKRWRETNAERNKDNDLRCRVTKLARAKFGPEDNEEKKAFIEREFETRRSKRTQKERAKAPYRIKPPAFRASSATATDLKDILSASLSDGKVQGVEAAGRQLIDMLVSSAGQQVPEGTLQAALALRSELASQDDASLATEEAMRILSSNDDLRRALEGSMRQSLDLGDLGDGVSEDDEDIPDLNGHSREISRGPVNQTNGVQANASVATMADSLHAALSTLAGENGENDENAPRQPRARKPTAKLRNAEEQSAPRRSRGKKRKRDNSALLDPSSIDAFLALANGGSLDTSDNDDEEAPPQTDTKANTALELSATLDNSFEAVLERVARRIVTKRHENDGAGTLASSSSRRKIAHISEAAVRQETAQLRALLSDSGMSVNTLMPASQAQALSKFHTQLRKYIEAEAGPIALQSNGYPSGEVYGHLHSAGKGKKTRPNSKSNLSELASLYVSAMPTKTSQLAAGGPAKHDPSAEEASRVKLYGFPPLPGQGFASTRRNRRKRR